ncbi:MAG TPA: hypothetical protein VGC67_10365 [Cellulomonas sp.]
MTDIGAVSGGPCADEPIGACRAGRGTGGGLDAITFQNVATGQTTVAFQGSNGGTDRWNNAQPVTSLTPAQLEAAEAYPNRVGPVDFVCGNSPGGGLAAYVAARDPGIEAVTVNPAPVPGTADVLGDNHIGVDRDDPDDDRVHVYDTSMATTSRCSTTTRSSRTVPAARASTSR